MAQEGDKVALAQAKRCCRTRAKGATDSTRRGAAAIAAIAPRRPPPRVHGRRGVCKANSHLADLFERAARGLLQWLQLREGELPDLERPLLLPELALSTDHELVVLLVLLLHLPDFFLVSHGLYVRCERERGDVRACVCGAGQECKRRRGGTGRVREKMVAGRHQGGVDKEGNHVLVSWQRT